MRVMHTTSLISSLTVINQDIQKIFTQLTASAGTRLWPEQNFWKYAECAPAARSRVMILFFPTIRENRGQILASALSFEVSETPEKIWPKNKHYINRSRSALCIDPENLSKKKHWRKEEKQWKLKKRETSCGRPSLRNSYILDDNRWSG